MGVGLTSLGHPWTGRRRPHNHYVIGDPANKTSTAHSVGTAGCRSPSTGDCRPQGIATEELLSTTLLGPLARGRKTDHSGAARVQRCPAPPAADPTGNAGHGAEPRRSCSATTPSRRVGRRPRWGNCWPQYVPAATAELLGTTRLGNTDCGPFKGRVLWWSRGSYVPEQAPQGARPQTRMEPLPVRAGGAA